MKYAGIGSRKTPLDVCEQMGITARGLSVSYKATLRSGRAAGADLAFEIGAASVKGKMELFTLRDVEANPHWIEHAKMFHPKWRQLDRDAQGLHARNSAIMLGFALNDPVKFVVCWTPDGLIKGGTGQALRIAAHLKIPVFNFFATPTFEAFANWFKEQGLYNATM